MPSLCAPLLHADSNSGGRTPSGHFTVGKPAGSTSFFRATSLDSAINSVKQLSQWSVWRSESDHVAMVSKLDYVMGVINSAESQWANSTSEAGHIAILSRLETMLSASEGVPQKCLELLADEIEAVFPPENQTTQDDMKMLLDEFVALSDKTTPFKSKDKDGEPCFMTVGIWCDCVLIPHSPATKPHMPAYAENLEKFQAWLGEQSILMRDEFYSKYQTGKLPIMAECLRKGLSTMFTAGSFEILTKKNFTTRSLNALEQKKELHWSAFGPSLCGVLAECKLKEHVFNSTPEHKDYLQKVGLVVLPQFRFNLCKLKGLYESQIKDVNALRAKALAGVISAAIAGGQLAATYLTHMLYHQEKIPINATFV